jgi:hypothetical protein
LLVASLSGIDAGYENTWGWSCATERTTCGRGK